MSSRQLKFKSLIIDEDKELLMSEESTDEANNI